MSVTPQQHEEELNVFVTPLPEQGFIKALSNRGWSQENIARAIGVTRPTIKRSIDGERVMDLEERMQLATLNDLGLSYKQFIEDAIEMFTAERVRRPAWQRLANKEIV